MRRTFLFILAACTPPAFAQQGLITHSWSITEVLAATNTPVLNPNGVIEPGEGARFSVTVSYTPPFGTFISVPGQVQGTIAGLGAAWFSIRGTGGAQGTWTGIEMAAGLVGYEGIPTKGGSLLEACTVGYLNPPNATNPIVAAWSQTWTSTSYTPRTVTFAGEQPGDLFSNLIVQTGTDPTGQPVFGTWRVPVQYTSAQVQIAPAPGTAALMAVAAVIPASRRPVL